MTVGADRTPRGRKGSPVPDAVTIEVVRNALAGIAEEMNVNLARSAFSPVIYEMKDCSVGLFDRDGSLLGQSPGLPLFLGGLDEAVKVTIAAVGLESFGPGDAFVVNDPYLVGSHLNDVTAISPIFHRGDLVGFTAAKAHWRDVGAKDAGFSCDTTEVYQEGLRFPPCRVLQGGEPVGDVIDLFRRNSRAPETLVGDLNAQIAACRTGERGYSALLDKLGTETVTGCTAAIFAESERQDRAAVQAIPDGAYVESGIFDGDGVVEDPVEVRVKVVVDGTDIAIDVSGSSRSRGCTNCGIAQTISAARLAFKYLLTPATDPSGGSFRNLEVIAEPGSIFAAEEPAACQFYSSGLGVMINLVFKALANVMPDRVIAGQTDDSMNVLFVGRSGGELYEAGEATAIGWGASAHGDGGSAMIDSMGGDLKNFPIETFEVRYPLRVLRYELNQRSAGAGRFRGGLGIVKDYEVLEETELTVWFERSKMPGWGLFGGRDGSAPEVVLNPGGSGERRFTKANHLLVSPGCVVSARTGGGGGFGDPAERPRELVDADLEDGYVTADEAREHYPAARRTLELALEE